VLVHLKKAKYLPRLSFFVAYETKKMQCTNHTCSKPIDPAKDRHILCSLCNTTPYCSEECQAVDWVQHTHVCGNIIEVRTPKLAMAVPYYFHDRTDDPEILAEMPDEQYLVMHRGADHVVSQQLVGALANGCRPMPAGGTVSVGSAPDEDLLQLKTYKLVLSDPGTNTSVEFQGSIPRDMIFPKNTANPKANKIAGGKIGKEEGVSFVQRFKKGAQGKSNLFRQEKNKYVFWLNPSEVTKKNLQVDLAGDLGISLYLSNGSTVYLGTGYALQPAVARRGKLGRKLKGYLSTQYDVMGLTALGYNAEDLQSCYFEDAREGTAGTITFLVSPGSTRAQIVNVILMVRKNQTIPAFRAQQQEDDEEEYRALPPIPEAAAHEIYIDPSNVAHLVGLTMAAEYFIAAQQDKESPDFLEFERQAGIVRKFTRSALDEGKEELAPEQVPMAVNTAIKQMTNVMYVDSSSRNFFTRTISVARYKSTLKNMSDADLQREFDKWLNAAKQYREQEGGVASEEIAKAEAVKDAALKRGTVLTGAGELDVLKKTQRAARKSKKQRAKDASAQ
jgi:hypothetical protein